MDPIRTIAMNNRFTAIVEEASATLYRTAFTSYVKLAQDFQCALATPEGAQLMSLFASIKSVKVRRRVVELVKAIVDDPDSKRG